ncbi:MAG: hypothetical protein JJ975_00280 [Bacteroidia bacterium]|nr:hypothetical protein [Bacteroidia bacterium]
MNKLKWQHIVYATLFVFVVITYATSKIETPFDGDDTYGFPFTFYIVYSGMCDPCPDEPTQFYGFKLWIDILFSAILAVAGLIGQRWLRHRLHGSKP